MKKLLIICSLLLVAIDVYSQKTERSQLGKIYAEAQLKEALKGKGINVIDSTRAIIKDSLIAIAVAEPLLFSVYGEENIKRQRPYEIYHIDNYWVIYGTLPSGMMVAYFYSLLTTVTRK